MDHSAQAGRGILVVEDDAAIREFLTMFLEGEGYLVHTAENGLDAMKFLQHTAPPCLILLDLMMPVMDGWKLSAELKRDPALASIPVVVFSALNDAKEQAKALGAVDFIPKPIDFVHLYHVVQYHC